MNSLASARDVGKTPAVSDELLRTKAKEEEEEEEEERIATGDDGGAHNAATTKYCEEFLNCTVSNTRRREQSRVLRLNFERDKPTFRSVLSSSSSSSSSSEDKENRKMPRPRDANDMPLRR